MVRTFLGFDAGEWSAIGTVATAVIAVAAAAFAFAQVREARRTREDQVQPFVVVDIQPSRAAFRALNLVVENIGQTLAREVRFTFDPPLATTLDDGEYPLAQSTLVQEGVAMLPPGRRIEALFDMAHERDGSNLPMRYEVTVSLQDARGRAMEPQRYVIDLRPLFGLLQITEHGVHHAAEALRGVERELKKWSHSGRLQVSVRDQDRERADERVEEFLTGRPPTLGNVPPNDLLIMLGRSSVLRALVAAVGPLHRWLQRRLA